MAAYGLEAMGQSAQDAFWWIVLEELRGHMEGLAVDLAVHTEESRHSLDRLKDVRSDVSLSITGRLDSLVRPLPPAGRSIDLIREAMDRMRG